MAQGRFGIQGIISFLSSRKPKFFYITAIILFLSGFFLEVTARYVQIYSGSRLIPFSFHIDFIFELLFTVKELTNVFAFGLILYGLLLQVSKQIKIESERDVFINIGRGADAETVDVKDEGTLLRAYYSQVLR